MPNCHLAKRVHNKWLQQSRNKMTCLYKATMDDLSIKMQIIGHGWKGVVVAKALILASLKLKVVAKNGDPKLLAYAWSFIQRHKSFTLEIVCWRGQSCLILPNWNWTCHSLPIITLIDLVRLSTPFLILTLMQLVNPLRRHWMVWCKPH